MSVGLARDLPSHLSRHLDEGVVSPLSVLWDLSGGLCLEGVCVAENTKISVTEMPV
jgi:hypothetical protein